MDAPLGVADALGSVPGLLGRSLRRRSECEHSRARHSGRRVLAVGMLEDGLPVQHDPGLGWLNADQSFRLDDTIERIEVVRGGPASMFSSNAPGGVVNFITRKPGDEPEGNVKVESERLRLAARRRLVQLRPSAIGASASAASIARTTAFAIRVTPRTRADSCASPSAARSSAARWTSTSSASTTTSSSTPGLPLTYDSRRRRRSACRASTSTPARCPARRLVASPCAMRRARSRSTSIAARTSS